MEKFGTIFYHERLKSMRKTGTCKLKSYSYAYGSVAELADMETQVYVIPKTISLELDGEPLRYTQVDNHGNPQIGGVAHTLLTWKIRQMVRDGKIDSEYDALVSYCYETAFKPRRFSATERLPRPNVCPVCGRRITAADLDKRVIIKEDLDNGAVATSSTPYVTTIRDGDVVVHKSCAKEYERLQIIDDITEYVILAFSAFDIDEENRLHWGKGDHGMWYELIPNEYCSRSCCAHRPWFLFHTPMGDIKIGWRKRVVNLTFMSNFVPFDMDIFENEEVTKHVRGGERTIHAWGTDKMYEYLCRVRKAVLPNKDGT